MNRNDDVTCTVTLRSKDNAIQEINAIKQQPSEALKVKMRKQYGLKESPNALFDLQVDVFKSVN